MDNKREPNISDVLRQTCTSYREDYHIFRNTHDKIASLIISEIDELSRKFKNNPEFMKTTVCCFILALQEILEEKNSTNFLNRLQNLCKQCFLYEDLEQAGNLYQSQISDLVFYLKMNSGFVPSSTWYTVDGIDIFKDAWDVVNDGHKGVENSCSIR